MTSTLLARALLLALAMVAGAGSASAQSWSLERWEPPYDFSRAPTAYDYSILESARQPWRLCVIFPHLKDPFWVAGNYGVVDQAEKLGVEIDLFESGGYPNRDRQVEQLRACAAGDYDAILIGSVSYDSMEDELVRAAESMPVLATINQTTPPGVTAMAAISWRSLGESIGEFFREKHPVGSDPVTIGWLPGPASAGWVQLSDVGFRETVEDSAAEIVDAKYGDTGKSIQYGMVEQLLDENPDLDYLAGNAVAIETAMSVVRRRGLQDEIKLVSLYFTPAIWRGLRRGLIASASTDQTALQGRISVDQAVRHLEGLPFAEHVGPEILNVEPGELDGFPVLDSIAPPTFKPTFAVRSPR